MGDTNEDEYRQVDPDQEAVLEERGFLQIKLKTDWFIIWTIVFINLVICWVTYFMLLVLNVDKMNTAKKTNNAISVAKAIMIMQGVLCLFAGLFLFSIAKKMKWKVLPLALFFTGIAIASFILAARLGAINKAAKRGDVTTEILQAARGFTLVMAIIYSVSVGLFIGYIWFFKPAVYNYLYYKLASAFTFSSDDDDIDDDDDVADMMTEPARSRADTEFHDAVSTQRSRQRQVSSREKAMTQAKDDQIRAQREYDQSRKRATLQAKRRQSSPPSYRTRERTMQARPHGVVTGVDRAEGDIPSLGDIGEHLTDFGSSVGKTVNAAIESETGKRARAKINEVTAQVKERVTGEKAEFTSHDSDDASLLMSKDMSADGAALAKLLQSV